MFVNLISHFGTLVNCGKEISIFLNTKNAKRIARIRNPLIQ